MKRDLDLMDEATANQNPFADPESIEEIEDPLIKPPPEDMIVGFSKVVPLGGEKKKKRKEEKDKPRDLDKEKLKFEKVRSKKDPLESINFSKPNGKIEIKAEEEAKKYKYYI